MKTTTRILTIIYVLAGLAYILLGDDTAKKARLIIKGCLIPVLIIIFTIHFRHNLKGINIFMLAGLLFSWAGDVAIDFSFVPG